MIGMIRKLRNKISKYEMVEHSVKAMFIFVVSLTLLILIVIASFVYYYDPFFHFHEPRDNVRYEFFNEAYQNAGIARNFDYNAIIVGSSMTEQLFPSEFDEAYGCKTCKTPYAAATTKNIKMVLDQAFKYHKEKIDYVFWGMDPYAMTTSAEEYHQEIPDYLYDDSKFNDFLYLINKEVIKQIFDNRKNGKIVEYDDIFIRDDDKEYSQRATVSLCNELSDPEDISMKMSYEELDVDDNVIENVEHNILPVVRDNPDTRFIFFIPPYPIVQWNGRSEQVNAIICNYNYVYERLSEYSNTELHFLQLMDETDNLYLYKDTFHYNKWMGRKVPNALTSGRYKITEDRKEDLYNEFFGYASTADFSIYSGEEYPFQNCTDLESYLNEIKDDRFIKIAMLSNCGTELTEDEINILKSFEYIPQSYEIGPFISIIDSDKKMYGSEACINCQILDSFMYADDDTKAEIVIDAIDYVTESHRLIILVYDEEAERVADVAGLRDDTRELKKY